MIKIVLTILLTTLFYFFCHSQEIDLSEWKKDTIPIGSKLNEANNSNVHWFFKKRNDSIFIEQIKYERIKGDSLPFNIDSIEGLRGNIFVKSVFNGYLVGYNHGEFGGGLKFVSLYNHYSYNINNNDRENEWKYGYMNNNIEKIFVYNNKIYATRGLSHMTSTNGSLIEIFYDNGLWKYKVITKLIECPDLTIEHNGLIYFITLQYIVKMNKELSFNQILKSPLYWGVLYPNSTFIKGADIYIAMRKGIMIIRDFENNPNYEWYIKKP